MTVKKIIKELEQLAPLVFQENYDNSGLQVGDINEEVKGVLISLDVTEAIIDEAIERGCNMIVAHHPLIFSGLKSITGKNYVERIILKAIQNKMALYAIHTNLDNMMHGVNAKIAAKLGLQNIRILAPLSGQLFKLYTYVPLKNAESLKTALFEAGAGKIGEYGECSFSTEGIGTFKPSKHSNPTIGKAGGEREAVNEIKLEVLVQKDQLNTVIEAMKKNHPYEEVAYEILKIENLHQEIGAGMTGELKEALPYREFLQWVKDKMQTCCIRYTQPTEKYIQKIAVCGGSGSFLLQNAIRAGADAFITGDFKYHQFFDADGRILIADIGHYESEQFTIELILDYLKEKFPNFAILSTNLTTNPIKYFS